MSGSSTLRKRWPPRTPVKLQNAKSKTGEFLAVDESGRLVLTDKKDKATWFLVRGLKQGYTITVHGDGEDEDKGAQIVYAAEMNIHLTTNRENLIPIRQWDFEFDEKKENVVRITPSGQKGTRLFYIAAKKDGVVAQSVSDGTSGTKWRVIVQEDLVKYECPLCKDMLTEDELWEHWPRAHGQFNQQLPCPICRSRKPVGSTAWGYSNHLFLKHGPPVRRPVPEVNHNAPTHMFSLVVVQHPDTGKFLIVEEGCGKGWWLPGGHVDPGETFEMAAIRECKEEGGIDIEITGILRFEHTPWPTGGGRQRMIFLARPKDKNQKPKSEPDFESLRAEWISLEQLDADVSSGKMKLRGSEPLEYFAYVARGGTVHSRYLIARENDPVVTR